MNTTTNIAAMNKSMKALGIFCLLLPYPGTATAIPTGNITSKQEASGITIGTSQASSITEAENYVRQKQLDKANSILDRVLQAFEPLMQDKGKQYVCIPDDTGYQNYLDAVKSGKTDNARPVVRLDNAYAKALYLKGWIASERSEWTYAIEVFTRQAACSPLDPSPFIEMGYALNRSGEPQKAYEAYQKANAIAADTGQEKRYSAMTMRGMGSALIEMEALDEAADLFDRSLLIDPANRTALNELEYIEIQKLKAAAVKGDAEASYRLGMLYMEGSQLVEVNHADAKALFEAAAAKNYPGGDDGIGWMYLNGLGVRIDMGEGMRRIKLSAKQGFAPAEYHLGRMNQFGIGVPKNLQQAVHWYRLSAGKGYIPAQKILAPICFEGVGKHPDRTEGVHWLVLAASGGDIDAQGKLGYLYFGNEGVTKDLDEAVKWTKSAAEHGDPLAQYALATCYFKGIGVSKDTGLGLSWLQKSCSGGNQDACKSLDDLSAGSKYTSNQSDL